MVFRRRQTTLWREIKEYEKDLSDAATLTKKDAIRVELSFLYRKYIKVLHQMFGGQSE